MTPTDAHLLPETAMRLKIAISVWCGSLIFTAAVERVAVAEQVIFTIDSATATISGEDFLYGTLFPQGPGSLDATASGHFLVDFDPFSGAPTFLTFQFGHGWMEFNDSGNWFPGPDPAAIPGNQTNPAPANYALQSEFGDVRIAVRNENFDFRNLDSQIPIAVDPVDGSFDITKVGAKGLDGGTRDYYHAIFGYGTQPTGDSTGKFAPGGTASLVETSPGDWTLTMSGQVPTEYGGGVGTIDFDTNIVATARFGAANVASIHTGAGGGSALGGATTPGGVDVTFSSMNTEGTLSVQQIGTTGLSLDAVAAVDANFKTAGSTPQIWDVSFDGSFTGPLTLTFGYDDTQLGIAEENLFLWHFDEGLNEWEQLFGIVDTDLNTITVSADSLSPFVLGVPEPSTLYLLAAGAAVHGFCVWRRRRRRAGARAESRLQNR